jgi:hypothetical protein
VPQDVLEEEELVEDDEGLRGGQFVDAQEDVFDDVQAGEMGAWRSEGEAVGAGDRRGSQRK